MVHVGVDLHKRVSQIAVLTADGELAQHRLPNDLGQLESFFAQLPTPSPIAIEAPGRGGGWSTCSNGSLSVPLSLARSSSIVRIAASGAGTGTFPSCYRV
jgi:hypothetical protein